MIEKFRAWDEGKMLHSLLDTNFGLHRFFGILSDEAIVMQSSGIKDVNGTNIFEGDLIKIPDDWDTYGMNAGEVYEIFFNAGGFRCKPKINPKAKGIWLEDEGEFEIIGNVYENPELIPNAS